jgi:hypothetical protein
LQLVLLVLLVDSVQTNRVGSFLDPVDLVCVRWLNRQVVQIGLTHFFNQTLVALFAVRLPDRFFESFHVNIDWGLFPHCGRGLLLLGCPVNEHVLNYTGWERFQIFSGQSVF